MWTSISHVPLLSVGLNCGFGPDVYRPLVEEFSKMASCYLSVYPNAGLPNDLAPTGFDLEEPQMTPSIREWADNGWLNIIGGCCGTTPEFIRAFAKAVEGVSPRVLPVIEPVTRLCGTETMTIRKGSIFVNIGERTNITGSPKFAKLILADDYEAAIAVAQQQVDNGAQIIDVNMDEGLIDSVAAMSTFLNLIQGEPNINKVPIMIDSSKWEVLEAGLRHTPGKGIVNSISLKEGEEKFKQQAKLIKRYGAAMVVMAFDELGQADTTLRAQARDLWPRVSHPHRGSGREARGHHLRPERPYRGHRHGGAPQLRGRLHQLYALDKGEPPGREGERWYQQHLVLVPRQQHGS